MRRDAAGNLTLVPYHVAYADELKAAADILREAADLAESSDFANYLKLRAAALISDEFQMSDLYWMDVKDNEIDVVIGPIEVYEDRLFGYRAGYESYVLIKDLNWSAELARFAAFLPELQEGLPVPDQYKAETPGNGLRPQRLRRRSTTRGTATPVRRPLRSTCRTTRRSSCRRARGACS